MDILSVTSELGREVVRLTTEAESGPLFQVNLFQVIIASANFLLFLAIIWTFAFKPVSKMLAERRDRIEQGLKDAEQARRDRENAEAEQTRAIGELRGEVADLALAAAGRVVGESMTDDRQRRLVQEFLATPDARGDRSN